jgi:hypothetical protein
LWISVRDAAEFTSSDTYLLNEGRFVAALSGLTSGQKRDRV